ncbi:MAG: hypothetical protein NC116_12250 [Clostridium sp.]|nr:hypothetical protein [Clostridium sp.]
MAYVQPSGKINIINCPLSTDYNHTFWFESAQSQAGHFWSAYGGLKLEKQLYTRVTLGVMRVSAPIAEMLKYNYLQWQDTEHGSKWYYAFIMDYEYINEGCTEIRFELDVIQTYMFDWTLKRCFVERQHATKDEIGDNLQPEPVVTGEYVYETQREMIPDGLSDIAYNMYVIVSFTQHQTANSNVGSYSYDGVATGSQLLAFRPNSAILKRYIQYPPAGTSDPARTELVNSVNAIYLVPGMCLSPYIPTGETPVEIPDGFKPNTYTLNLEKMQNDTGFNTYKPKNMKLYTYPYNYLTITNGSGQELALRYELFRGDLPRFQFFPTITRPVQIVCRPLNYSSPDLTGDYTSKLDSVVLSNFPQGQWITGGFESWVANNSVPFVANTFSGIVGNISSGNAGGAVGAVINSLMTMYREAKHVSGVSGVLNSGTSDSVHRMKRFYRARTRVHSQQARVIDDFFTMFGYAQNRLLVPNIHARKGWTFVKTQNSNIVGPIPHTYKRQITSAFDHGITFWAQPQAIMDYTADNLPL